jgi:hypothetical protein
LLLVREMRTYRELEAALPRIREPLLAFADRWGLMEDGHFPEERLNALIENVLKMGHVWPRSRISQKYKHDEETWKEMANLQPKLKPLRDTFSLLEQLEQPNFLIGSDNRNRFWYRPMLTKTGRCASSPVENLLGAAKFWRGLVWVPPDADYAVVEADYSAQESWVAACRSGCPTLLREVMSGDIHMATAISMNLAPPGATAESHPKQRKDAKPIVHGSTYGITHVGISKKLGVPQREGRRLLNAYDTSHAVLREFQRAFAHHGYSVGRVAAPLGWSMRVTSKVGYRTLLNWLMQSCGSEILWCAVSMLIDRGFTIAATAHDSIYFLMPLDGLAERIALASEIMSSVTLPFTHGYPIPTKVTVVLPGERLLDAETRPVWDRLTGLARGQIPTKEALHVEE